MLLCVLSPIECSFGAFCASKSEYAPLHLIQDTCIRVGQQYGQLCLLYAPPLSCVPLPTTSTFPPHVQAMMDAHRAKSGGLVVTFTGGRTFLVQSYSTAMESDLVCVDLTRAPVTNEQWLAACSCRVPFIRRVPCKHLFAVYLCPKYEALVDSILLRLDSFVDVRQTMQGLRELFTAVGHCGVALGTQLRPTDLHPPHWLGLDEHDNLLETADSVPKRGPGGASASASASAGPRRVGKHGRYESNGAQELRGYQADAAASASAMPVKKRGRPAKSSSTCSVCHVAGHNKSNARCSGVQSGGSGSGLELPSSASKPAPAPAVVTVSDSASDSDSSVEALLDSEAGLIPLFCLD